MDTQTFISPDLIKYIKQYRTDEELISLEQSMIADAMCGLEITISGMYADKRTEGLLKRAMSAISSYHYLLSLIQKEK